MDLRNEVAISRDELWATDLQGGLWDFREGAWAREPIDPLHSVGRGARPDARARRHALGGQPGGVAYRRDGPWAIADATEASVIAVDRDGTVWVGSGGVEGCRVCDAAVRRRGLAATRRVGCHPAAPRCRHSRSTPTARCGRRGRAGHPAVGSISAAQRPGWLAWAGRAGRRTPRSRRLRAHDIPPSSGPWRPVNPRVVDDPTEFVTLRRRRTRSERRASTERTGPWSSCPRDFLWPTSWLRPTGHCGRGPIGRPHRRGW